MNTLLIDLRYGARMLMKKPGFTLIAVITLALGIGANTTIFSFVNAVLLRPLPYKGADHLVVPISFNAARGSDDAGITYADYLDWRNEGIFAHVAALDLLSAVDLTSGDGEPERVRVAAVSEDYFAVMGTASLFGRMFSSDDYNPPGRAGCNHRRKTYGRTAMRCPSPRSSLRRLPPRALVRARRPRLSDRQRSVSQARRRARRCLHSASPNNRHR